MTHASFATGASMRSSSPFARELASTARTFAKFVTFTWLLAVAAIRLCAAGELALTLVDRAGHPVSEVVMTIAPVRPSSTVPVAGGATAIMDQRNLSFVPQVLVVAVGTSVEFPNNDTVSHQVYSFSPAKKFQLPLYKGVIHPPVTFEKAGLVVVGCNIHDQMAGYIYVTDAPLFGKTDTQGMLRLRDVPGGDYLLTFWSPYIADPPASLTRAVRVGAGEGTSAQIQLTRDLRTRPEPRPRRADWEY